MQAVRDMSEPIILIILLALATACGGAQLVDSAPPEGALQVQSRTPLTPESTASQEPIPEVFGWRLEDCSFGPIRDGSQGRSAESLARAVGLEVAVEDFSAEGDVYQRFVARFNGEPVLSAVSGAYTIYSERIIGPGGLTVGSSGAQLLDELGSGTRCHRGVEDAAADVFCHHQSLDWVVFRFGNVPTEAGCVTDCPVSFDQLQDQRMTSMIFTPCSS